VHKSSIGAPAQEVPRPGAMSNAPDRYDKFVTPSHLKK
jgi:hypothetical protein